MEGVRAKGILAAGFGLAELLESGEGIIILSLATVLVVAVVVLVVLSNDRLYERVERLMRIAHGQSDADRSNGGGHNRCEPTEGDGGDAHDPAGRAGWSALGRRLSRRSRSERPQVRR
jgi:hypothetical protein